MARAILITAIVTFAVGGCAASIPPVEVTRFHLRQQISPGGVRIESAINVDSKSLEFGTYAAAVSRQLLGLGLRDAPAEPAVYSASIDYNRTIRDAAPKRSPISIGIGGGTGGGGLGIGVGTSFGIGKPKARQSVATTLSVKLKRLADQSIIWEGRAQTEAVASTPAAQPGLAADKLATALFKGFPGVSGATITVP